MQEQRRVVVTGLGVVSPLGTGVEKNWQALMAGRSGIRPITRFATEGFSARIAGEVPDFRAEDFIEPKEIKKMDLFIQYAISAAAMAMQDSGLKVEGEFAENVGVIIGVGLCGLDTIESTHKALLEGGPRKISPFFIPKVISNLAAGHIAIRHGAKGVNWTPTSACASGTHAIGEAFHLIRRGTQDAVVAGGAEAVITPLAVGGFASMKALSTRNEEPERASRPFDKARDGFVIGEGSGVLIIEEREHALRRGAKIYAEVLGYAANGDAYHMTSPAPEGEGAQRAMRRAMQDARLSPSEIDYINAHGTSTPANDLNETKAIKAVFGEYASKVNVSSTKSMTGHMLGAAGAVEFIIGALAVRDCVVPPTINYQTPDPELDLNYTPNTAVNRPVRTVLSNSFGFGGHNVTLAIRRLEV
jgi:3-oxoacyl-[acyl-carrier-protein] synthase II